MELERDQVRGGGDGNGGGVEIGNASSLEVKDFVYRWEVLCVFDRARRFGEDGEASGEKECWLYGAPALEFERVRIPVEVVLTP